MTKTHYPLKRGQREGPALTLESEFSSREVKAGQVEGRGYSREGTTSMLKAKTSRGLGPTVVFVSHDLTRQLELRFRKLCFPIQFRRGVQT